MTTILIVEDNDANRRMLVRRLERRGYTLLEASDGAAAISVALEAQPDLILMDMSLPVMHGWDASTRLKTDDLTRDIPIIALTAHAMTGDREKAFEAGCDDFDTKPYDLDRLIGKIEALTGSSCP